MGGHNNSTAWREKGQRFPSNEVTPIDGVRGGRSPAVCHTRRLHVCGAHYPSRTYLLQTRVNNIPDGGNSTEVETIKIKA